MTGAVSGFRIRCPSCRSEESPDAHFCSACGAPFVRAPNTLVQSDEPGEPVALEEASPRYDGIPPTLALSLRQPNDGSERPPSGRTSGDVGVLENSANSAAAAPPLPWQPVAAPVRSVRRWLLIGLGVLLVLWAAYASYGLRSNRSHAEAWRQRSLVLTEQADGMSRLLTARTSQLNVRIDQINRLAVKLRTTQDALGRSEGDVGTLEARQRALANEKAQVEDERAALVRTAALYRICKDDLITLLTDFANQDYTSATYDISTAQTSCGAADDSLGG